MMCWTPIIKYKTWKKKSKQGNLGNQMSGIILIQDTDNQTGAFQLENQWHEKGE